MEYHVVGVNGPVFLRPEGHEILLNFGGVLVSGEAEAVGDAPAMGVYNNARYVETFAQYGIGDFPADAGQAQQVVHGTGHPAVIVFQQHAAAFTDGPGFLVEKAAGADVIFEFAGGGFRKIARTTIFLEKVAADHIYARIGALRREYGHNQQMEGRPEVQGTPHLGIGFLEEGE